MKLELIDIAIFVVYILGIVFLGLYAARKGARSKRDYFLAGDKLPWWMIGGSIIAANISSHHLVGAMGAAYSRGFVAITLEWGAILIGFNALLWVFLPFYLRNGFYTIPEYLQRRFGGATRALYAVLILLTYVFVEIGAVLFLGALSLHALFGVPILYSIIGLAIITGIYTVLGGLKAVIWTEMVQLVVLVMGGIVLTFATVKAAGGFESVVESSKNWQMFYPASDPDFPWTMYLGGLLCISVFYCATNQFIVQRVLAAKNEWHGRMGVFIITVGILSSILLIGYSDKPVFLYLMNLYGLFTPGIATMFLMGIFWKRTTAKGALTAGLITIPLSILLEFVFPEMPFFNRTGIVFWTCMLACFVVSLLTKPATAGQLEGLIWDKESLKLPEGERKQYRGWKNPTLYWVLITAMVLYFYVRYF